MADKFPSFEYVPALAEYMLKFIDKLPSHDAERPEGIWYKVKEDAPDEARAAFNALSGTDEERYGFLLELSDADNTDDGVERYISEIEPPVYSKELLDWLYEDYDRVYAVDEVLKEFGGNIGLIRAIGRAWYTSRSIDLWAAVEVLEKYLNSGSDDAEEELDTE